MSTSRISVPSEVMKYANAVIDALMKSDIQAIEAEGPFALDAKIKWYTEDTEFSIIWDSDLDQYVLAVGLTPAR